MAVCSSMSIRSKDSNPGTDKNGGTEVNIPHIGDRVVVAGEWVTVDRLDGRSAGGWSDNGVYIYGDVAA